MSVIAPYGGQAPRLHPSAFVAEGGVVIGDVEIGEGSSVWYGTIVRGDVNRVRIGARTNLQDGTVVHVTSGTHPTAIGDDVTVGHRAVLHGCTVNDRCLVGIGAIVLDGAVVGPDAMVGAGALVPPGMVVPPGKLVLGAPAKVKRDLTAEELAGLRPHAARYVEYAARHRERQEGRP
jgi:carbonic anhydrase/acetyltransferase-like protein (isoleucine patch superfamily)